MSTAARMHSGSSSTISKCSAQQCQQCRHAVVCCCVSTGVLQAPQQGFVHAYSNNLCVVLTCSTVCAASYALYI
eukprot:6969-Heterococcus_DN1.PRE.1